MSLNERGSGTAATPSSVDQHATLLSVGGGFDALGPSEQIVPPHEHHAIQIAVAVEAAE
jgi:hypothetical protein